MNATALMVEVPSRAPRRHLRTVSRMLAIVAALMMALALVGHALVVSGTLIDPARFAHPDDALVVVDRHGRVLRLARVDTFDRRWVRLSEISPHLITAVIATEDGDFHAHHGVDWRAVLRSATLNLVPGRRLSGASTITQQLVKRVYGRRSGVWSKGLEMLRALTLERRYSKDEILEQYLNRLPYGDNIEGVARASESYLGHGPATMTVAEAALLAGIPQAPSITEPRRHLPRALARRKYVLDRMLARRVIDRDTWNVARREVPTIAALEARPWVAARFVDHALTLWREGALLRDGHVLRTSLDRELQHRVEVLLRGAVDRYATRGARNGAAVVIANDTGEVLAYVGAARDGIADAGGALDLARARRQPGSTLKPFVYELFFERGGTPATLLDDVAVSLRGARGSTFEARDYDGRERGPVRARIALASSLNLAALDAATRVGPDRIVARLRALGIRVPGEADAYGAAVVLGGVDVSVLELARAYVTLARGGTSVPLSFAPVATAPTSTRVMHPDAAALTWNVLTDGAARADAFGDALTALSGEPIALKTGTSQSWRDAWAAVATRRVTIVVWLGDPSGAGMRSISGFEAAAPVAARIVAEVTRSGVRVEAPALPTTTTIEAPICAHSGLRAGARCSHVVQERFARDGAPTTTCNVHDIDGRFIVDARYASWVERQHPAGVVVDQARASSTINVATVRVLEPRDGTRWLLDVRRAPPSVTLRATARGVRWEVDGVGLEGDRWTATPGVHHIVAVSSTVRSKEITVHVSTQDRVASAR